MEAMLQLSKIDFNDIILALLWSSYGLSGDWLQHLKIFMAPSFLTQAELVPLMKYCT